MKIFKIHTKQKLPISVDVAWDFLSSPKKFKKNYTKRNELQYY